MNLVISILIGLFAGISSGLFGIGGGIVIVPMLLFILKLSQVEAIGTSLIALLLPVGSLGVWEFYRNGIIKIDHIKIGLLISVGMVVGTLIGAKISSNIDSKYLSKMFAVFLVLVAFKIWKN